MHSEADFRFNYGTKLPLDRFVFAVLAGTLWAASAPGQLPSPTASISPPPISPTPPPLLALDTCTAAVTFSNGESQQLRSTSDVFPLISTAAGETLNIQLRFPVTLLGASVVAQSLDGGSVSPEDFVVGADGSVSMQVQIGAQPGLYRVLLNVGGQIETLQFSVPDPENPSPTPALSP